MKPADQADPALLQGVQPGKLHMSVEDGTSEAVGAVLARCPSLREIQLVGSLAPAAYPPGLRSLTIDFGDEETGTAEQVTSLLGGLAGLASLTELELTFVESGSGLSGAFSQLPALQRFSVDITFARTSGAVDLSLLQSAAAHGITVAFCVTLCAWDGMLLPRRVRQKLWAALAAVPSLHQLQLKDGIEDWDQLPLSRDEAQQLAAVRCRELILPEGLLSEVFGPYLTGCVSCEAVLLYHCFPGPSNTLLWAVLAARPGVYVLQTDGELTVMQCPGVLPAFDSPWALVLEVPEQGIFQGLPTSLFLPGPRGHLVWRNSAALDSHLAAAYDKLQLRDLR